MRKVRHRLLTCSLKASLGARKWWSQGSTCSLRLFSQLSLSVCMVGGRGVEGGDRGGL